MSEPTATPGAPAAPAPAAPATPGSAAIVNPVPEGARAHAEAGKSTGTGSLIDGAGKAPATDTPTPPNVEELSENAFKAFEAWQADPSEDNKKAVDSARQVLKDALAQAKTKAAEPPKVEVPDKYEIKLADNSEIDATILEAATPAMKEAGLTNEQANKLAPLIPQIQKAAVEQFKAAQSKAFEDARTKEKSESEKALGAQLQEELSYVAKARDGLFSPESRAVLGMYGNFLPLIKDLSKLGRIISEDKLADGASAGTDPGLKVLFPNSNVKQ